MKRAPLALALLAIAACSSTTNNTTVIAADGGPGDGADASTPPPPPPPPPLDAGSDAGPAPTNPYGAPYPMLHLGTTARQGSTPGNVIPNYFFQGYHPNDTTQSTVSLADFYDPLQKKYDVVLIVLGTAWDPNTRAMVQAASTSTRKIVTVIALAEGANVGEAATFADVTAFQKLFRRRRTCSIRASRS